MMLAVLTSVLLTLADDTCECSWKGRGCKITMPAPDGSACLCTLSLLAAGKRCSGTVVECAFPDSRTCKKPTKRIASCLQAIGQKNCGGYRRSCECTFLPHAEKGGCIISRLAPPAPSRTMCTCSLDREGQTCSGSLALCNDEEEKCRRPGASWKHCQGNCDGYPKIAYHPGLNYDETKEDAYQAYHPGLNYDEPKEDAYPAYHPELNYGEIHEDATYIELGEPDK